MTSLSLDAMPKHFLLGPCRTSPFCNQSFHILSFCHVQIANQVFIYGITVTYLIVVYPVLIAQGTVTRVNHRLRSSKVNTHFIPTNLSLFGITPELISTLSMARVKTHWLISLLLSCCGVQADISTQTKITNLRRSNFRLLVSSLQ